jgi:hypothetical protein
MRLAELQTKFQAGILDGDQTILASIRDSRRTDRTALFAVYHDAYRLRLVEFLSNDYPVLHNYLGEEAFGRLAGEYIESTTSRHRNARWYGAHLPGFMHETLPWRTNTGAVALARFEHALSDAADAPLAVMESLRATSAGVYPHLTFDFHPSVTLLDLAGGTAEIYEALAEGKEPPAIRDGSEAILFWRNDFQSFYRPAAEDERLALMEAMKRTRFSEICVLLAFQNNDKDVPERAASFLSQWFADGLISRWSIESGA